MMEKQGSPGLDLVVRRLVEAPVEVVWRTWTEPDLVKRWWGPQHYVSPVCKIDLRVGGRYLFCMRAPAEQGGRDAYNAGEFTKIIPRQLLEFTQFLSDAEGRALDPAQAGLPPDFPQEMKIVVTFEPRGEFTKLTLTMSGWTPGTMMAFAYAGWHQSFDKMEASLT